MLAGVRLGDAVVGLDHEPHALYDHVMARLLRLPRPLVVGFRKRMEGLGSSPQPPEKSGAAAPFSNGGGSGATPPAKAFAGGFGNSLLALKAAASAGAAGPVGGGSGLTTKVPLQEVPGSNEFDAVFDEGALGMRLEERPVAVGTGGLRYVSEVVHVLPDGAAEGQGVREGCLVVGINGERFISHAHAVATLKHGRRPVHVRFRRPGVVVAR